MARAQLIACQMLEIAAQLAVELSVASAIVSVVSAIQSVVAVPVVPAVPVVVTVPLAAASVAASLAYYYCTGYNS